MLYNIEGAVEEIKWAKEAGLSGGILLPGAPPGSGLAPLHDPVYEPIWQICEELEVPVNHHGGSASPPMNRGQREDIVMFLLQVTWWSHQILTHLIVGGVLERHPNMHLVFTEQGTAWVPEQLATLDYYFTRMRTATGSQEHEWGLPVMEKLPAAAERVLRAAVLHRRELHAAVGGRDPRQGRRRPHHVGQRLPAQGSELAVLA